MSLKPYKIIGLLFLLVNAVGCGKDFNSLHAIAQKAFEKGSYVEAADAALLALPRWKTKHGEEAKAETYQILGLSYQKQGKVEPAIEALTEAVKLSDHTYPGAIELGFIHLARSEPDLAVKTFQRALRMKPDDPMALLGLGNAFFQQKKYNSALVNFRRVLNVSPGVREALDAIDAINKKQKSGSGKRRRH